MTSPARVVGLIPARLASTRLPRKLLLRATGKPLLQYVWEAAQRAKSLSGVIIATDSLEIAEAAGAFGAQVAMTGEHPSGTDRIAEAVQNSCPDADIIVNLQGDEPELDPILVDRMVEGLAANPAASMATLSTPIRTRDQLDDPSRVKVVCAENGQALYFSRSVVPHPRDADIAALLKDEQPWRLHLGVYAYRREFLMELTRRTVSPLERLEKLEQLRALEMGARIQVVPIDHPSVGIDTPDDYARFVSRQRRAA